MQNDHIPQPTFPVQPDVNIRRRAIRETARLNRITPKRLAKHMKRHPDAPISQAIGALL